MNDSLSSLQTEFNRFFGSGADGLPIFKVNGLSEALGDRFVQNFAPPTEAPLSKNPLVWIVGALVLIYLLLK